MTTSMAVRKAIRAGCQTADVISDETGLPARTVSAHLTHLRRIGLIVHIGKQLSGGRPRNVYVLPGGRR